MWSRVFVPGFGNVWVSVPSTGSEGEAQARTRAIALAEAELGRELSLSERQSVTQVGASGPPASGDGFSISADGTVNNIGTGASRAFGDAPFSSTTVPDTVDPTTGTGAAEPVPANPPGDIADVPGGVLDPEAVSAFGTFREAIRGQVNPDSVLGGIAQQRFRPLRDTFALAQALQDPSIADIEGTAGNPAGFQAFLQSRGLRGGARDARSALTGLSNATNVDEDSILGSLFAARPGTNNGAILQSVAREALGTRLSPIAQSLFGSGAVDLASTRFEDQLARGAATGSSPSFAQFLRSQLRI